MKIRTDFVTNSSSSSFILAKRGEMNDAQKQAIAELIEETFFGYKTITSEEEFEQIAERNCYNKKSDTYKESIEELRNGGELLYGMVDFEVPDFDLAEMYHKIWRAMEENSDGNFKIIDGDLRY